MKIYVDELPKCCFDCQLCEANNMGCFMCYAHETDFLYISQDEFREKRLKNCPLKLLKYHDKTVKQHAYKKGYNDMQIQYKLGNYDKQIRKEVVQEIREKIEQAKMIYEWKGKEISIEDILDQIENGGINEKID